MQKVPMDKKVLSQWLKAGFMENGILYETDEGTPQGGIISPVLANLALDGLESRLKESFPQEAKIHFIRYADDFIITGVTKEILEDKVRPLVKEFIRERGLELSGVNPIIRGWANFHRHVVSKSVFHRVDFEITKAIWKWAWRRHPNKSRKWIKKRYFSTTEQGRYWCFSGRKDGKQATLTRASDVKIKRHVKVKGQSNPFDPGWESYFEDRLNKETAETIKGRRRVFRLWQEQDGTCPICRQKLAYQTDWHKHHIKWKIYGGKDTNDNLALLHPNCHRQVHSRKLKVSKLLSSQSVRKA